MRQAMTVLVVAVVLTAIGYAAGGWAAGWTDDAINNGYSTLSGYSGQADRDSAMAYHYGLYKLMGALFGLGFGLVITIVAISLPESPKARAAEIEVPCFAFELPPALVTGPARRNCGTFCSAAFGPMQAPSYARTV